MYRDFTAVNTEPELCTCFTNVIIPIVTPFLYAITDTIFDGLQKNRFCSQMDVVPASPIKYGDY